MHIRRVMGWSLLISIFFQIFGGDEMDSRLTPLGYQTAAFPVYGLSYMPGVVSKYKMMVGLDEKYMPSGMRKVFACPALSNDTLKLVPVNAIAYNWGGCYDFEQSWARAKQRLEENPELARRDRSNSNIDWKSISISISERMFCRSWAMRSAAI